ncbi:hypothetical protein [Halarsenatibacter silvermanii]|uniref:hypothetical protein n=1 Tax=Halarsenatibacter silvermanii TaxID=321763 RepID=UPI003CFF1E3A
MKGTLSNFAAEKAYNLAQKIETKAKKGDLENLWEDYEQLELAMKNIAESLNEFRTEIK